MDAAQILQIRTKDVLQKMVELRPIIYESGRARKGPTSMPARVMDDFIEKVSLYAVDIEGAV